MDFLLRLELINIRDADSEFLFRVILFRLLIRLLPPFLRFLVVARYTQTSVDVLDDTRLFVRSRRFIDGILARYLPRCGLSFVEKNNNRRNWKKQAFLFSPRARIASRRVPPFPSPFLPFYSDISTRPEIERSLSRNARMLKAPCK